MNNITAKIIAHSFVAETGSEIVTFEVTYPRFILPEVLTHRVFSRNTSSSRAVPSKKMGYWSEKIFYPIHWGKNKAGMSASEELSGVNLVISKFLWSTSAAIAFGLHSILSKLGGHKQWVNRIIEPYVYVKQVITTTELSNFFNLRCHKDAQPEIQFLANEMYKEYTNTHDCRILDKGDWHLPYIDFDDAGAAHIIDQDEEISLQDAILISVSACAQVSYRATDFSIEKARKIFKMLNVFNSDEPIHASPLEHQATPVIYPERKNGKWPIGVTHRDRSGKLWSGNFSGYVQLRHLLEQSSTDEKVDLLGEHVVI